MERQVQRGVGMVLCILGACLEAAHLIAFVHEHLPATFATFTDWPWAATFFLVGLIFVARGRERTAEAVAPAPAAAEPLTPEASTANTVSPTISPTISSTINPTINIHLPEPPQQIAPAQLLRVGAQQRYSAAHSRTELTHNVQYVRIREYGGSVLAACFENVPIPNQFVRTFNNVKVRTEYNDFTTENNILTVFPSGWVENQFDEVYMKAGERHYATIAMFTEGRWSAAEVETNNTQWGTTYGLCTHALPFGDLLVVITLIADHGMSIEPERFHLRIERNGTANVKHLPRVTST